ncbi:MAG TPA: LysR substrate-binding domain-containing protein, partial [Magnetospirillum sp.]|nr:LysR substrate-binding domain-containing protein [Magnetospirillum sp.]
RSVSIGRDVLVPVAAPGAVPNPASDVPYLAYAEESGMGRILVAELKSRPALPLRPVFTSHLSVVLRTMVEDGRGLAWLPLSLVERDLEQGRLVRVVGDEWDVGVDIRLFRPRARLSPAAEALWARVA